MEYQSWCVFNLILWFLFGRCILAIEEFNNTNEFTKFVKRISGANIVCGLSYMELKLYIHEKYEEFLLDEPQGIFQTTNRIGLQEDGTMVYNSKVRPVYNICHCRINLIYRRYFTDSWPSYNCSHQNQIDWDFVESAVSLFHFLVYGLAITKIQAAMGKQVKFIVQTLRNGIPSSLCRILELSAHNEREDNCRII